MPRPPNAVGRYRSALNTLSTQRGVSGPPEGSAFPPHRGGSWRCPQVWGAGPGRSLRCGRGRGLAVPSGAGGLGPAVPSGAGGLARTCPQVGAALPPLPPASPPVRAARGGGGAAPDGGPGRAGPLRGRLLAGAGVRRAGAGGAAGGRVRRRVLLRPAHLRGRHRHLPQPRLVGVLVRGQPGGAARGAAGRRGAGGAQGPRGHAAAAAGARAQPAPHHRARARPPRRHGAAAPRGAPRPPRRARQDLLKICYQSYWLKKRWKCCKLWKENSLLKAIGFSHCGIISASIVDSV